MRDLNKTDVVMLDNVMRLLKQVVSRSVDFDEMLGAAQTWGWINKLRSELSQSLIEADKKKQFDAAIASAKEVTPQIMAAAEVKESKKKASK